MFPHRETYPSNPCLFERSQKSCNSHVTRYVVAHGLDGNITDTQSDHRLHFHFVGRTAGMYRPHHGMFRSVTLLIKALGSHDD